MRFGVEQEGTGRRACVGQTPSRRGEMRVLPQRRRGAEGRLRRERQRQKVEQEGTGRLSLRRTDAEQMR